jgi:hypothetical protein
VEAQLAEDSRAKVTSQNYLELDTVERVMTRVKSWTTLFLYFAGVPLAVTAFAFAFLFGKNAWDLNHIAANAKSEIEGMVNEAKSKGAETKSTVTDSLNASKQVASEIHETQRRVAELDALVQRRISDVQKLDAKIENSQARIDGINKSLDTQSQKVTHLSETVKAVETQKNVLAVRQSYPALYGAHEVRSNDGTVLDAKAKSTSDIYVLVAMWEGTTAIVSEDKFAAALEGLQASHYTVFQRSIYLNANSGTSGATIAWIGVNECDAPPCIVYFKEGLREKALHIKALVAPAQTIPDDKVRFLSPKTMSPPLQELLQKSGLDMVVVLGTR